MADKSFRTLYNRSAVPEMTPAERERTNILIVEENGMARNQLRQTLVNLGYSTISDAPNHLMALKKLDERRVTHVIFDAKKTNMPVQDFLVKVLESNEDVVTLPSSAEPTVDDVFGLLTLGARGYIVKPFNSQAIEEAIAMATKGEPISDAILYAKNRNEALASLMVTALGNAATIIRQAQQFETAQRDVPKKMLAFRRAAEISRLFSDGGNGPLLDAIIEFCIERGSGPATRLGRIRKRLEAKKTARAQQQQEEETSDTSEEEEEQQPPGVPSEL